MKKELIAVSSIKINSSPEKVWTVLTDPKYIRKYLFGTKVKTNWEVGSPIIFQGEYNNQQYTDKGNVIEKIENQLLKYNYWSKFSGLEDKSTNYSLITYQIEKLNHHAVKLTWLQQGFSDKKAQKHTQESLIGMLNIIRELAEEKHFDKPQQHTFKKTIKTSKPKTIEQYIENASHEFQQIMKALKSLIEKTVPDAKGEIKWNVPIYRYNGILAGFDVAKNHVTFGIDCLVEENRRILKELGYKTGKQTIQIQRNQEIPIEILEELLRKQAKINTIRK